MVVFDAPASTALTDGLPDETALPIKVIRGVLQSVGLSAPSTQEYIKRVIGLPGETVEGRQNRVFVDGKELVEPYLPLGPTTRDFPPVTLGENELWVMGDNRENSSDSRVFGPIDESTVVGRAFVRVWPPGRTAFL